MNVIDARRKIIDAVDANFDAQLASTKAFIAIPSTRGAVPGHDRRSPAAARLRGRSIAVVAST
jgi:hypothetical protein